MKRKVKRKLFLMGMAVSTGVPGGAFAKDTIKSEGDRHGYVSHGQGSSMYTPTAELPGYGVGPTQAYAPLKGWRLELLQNDARPGQVDHPRMLGEKRLGLALRLTF